MILVTGGTGFIGRRLLHRLLERGEQLKVLVRPDSLAPLPQAKEVEVVVGDITDPSAVRKAVEGCKVVMHLAALRARFHPDHSAFERVNVVGTRTVLEEALEQGVGKVLHVSTAMVLGSSQGRPKAEGNHGSLVRFVSKYQRTKFLADLEAKRFLEHGLPVVILFPSTTYGPSLARGESPVTDIALAFARGRFVPLIGTGDCRCNLVYVEDVVDGLLLALDRGRPGEGYILGGENVSPREFLALLGELTGRSIPRWHIPAWTARTAGWIFEKVALVTKKRPPLTRTTIDILSEEWMVSSEKAEKELGYRPTPLKEGLRRTLAACLERSSAP